MQRYSALIAIVLLFTGCSIKQHNIEQKNFQIDGLLLQGVYLESNGYYEAATRFYEKLFALTKNPLFLEKIITDLYRAGKYDKALQQAKKAIKRYPKNKRFYELLATIYFVKKEYAKAIGAIQKAIAIEPSAKDLEFLASIYLAQKEYNLALKYYKSAYALQPTDKTIESIAYIMYFYLDQKKDAIAYLETHTRLYGCKKEVCKELASLYSLQNNIHGLISVYTRLYTTYKSKEYLKKLIELFIYQKDFQSALEWAKKLKDDKLLLSLYKALKDYKNAYKVAKKLYDTTHDLRYLAQEAIFEYESASKKDIRLLKDIAKKLEKVIKKIPDPMYLNYLGYLYIDHGLNIMRGIALVKKALQAEPDSPYYLDSLAWGYYKIGKCKEALKIIERVYYDMDFNDPEVKSHLEAIQNCAKKEKK